MWLFTSIGFFSVVKKTGEQHLTVRARASVDLGRLRKEFMPELSSTLTKGGTDYPFRATIGQHAFTKGLSQLGDAIDYHNFKNEVAERMGQERAHTYLAVWSAAKAIEAEPPAKAPAGKLTIPGMTYGGVVINRECKVLLREPKKHYDGYVWTFAKGDPKHRETEEQAALREVREETGVVANIEKRIPGEFQGGTSKTIYFLMSVAEQTGELDDETQSIAWVTRDEAVHRIQRTSNEVGRKRDLEVLKAALQLYEKIQPGHV